MDIDDYVAQFGVDKVSDQLALLSGYETPVPPIDRFIDDPFYLGKVLGDGLFPIWREAARELFPTAYYSPYQEVILTGAIGLGKTTGALLITMYDICRMLSLKNPHAYYKLIESTVISFAMINATQGLASRVLMSQVTEWIENSPYFKSKLSINGKTLFQKNIDITVGSRGRDMLGQATAGAIFSEINDMTVVGGQAQDNFDTIATRRNSRFGGKGVPLIGHLILDSSNKGTRSFIDSRIEEKKKKGIHDYKIFSFAHWEAKWHLGTYSGKFFKVYGGDENRDPFIMEDQEIDPVVLAALDPSRIIEVPIEHRDEFKFNILKSLGDLAGISTFSNFSFISSMEVLNAAFKHINPVSKEVIVLDFFNENQVLMDFINIKMLNMVSSAPRFIHIDLGLSCDSTGIACSYLEGYKDVVSYDAITGSEIINREPKFVTEWVMEITALPGQEVAIYKIKNFILGAKSMGYPIMTVSTDGFQSSNLRQDLLLKGINTQLLSVDRTKDPYDLLRNAILEGRANLPKSPKLFNELRYLQDTGDKYDHDSESSKDLSDAVCGSIFLCKQHIDSIGTVVDPNSLSTAIKTIASSSHMSTEDKLKQMMLGRSNYG